jgi:hypothetical protein
MYQQLAVAGVRSLENYSVDEKVRLYDHFS